MAYAEDEELTKKFYGIADVAEIAGVTQSTLRYWESVFPQLKPRRSDGATRRYTPRDIELVRLIKFLLKDKGMRIERAREYIRTNRADLDRRADVVRRLKDVRGQLVRLRNALDSIKPEN